MHATVRFDERPVRVVDVHLGAGVGHDERVRQARLLLDHARGVSIIAGDLNAQPGSDELELFAQSGWTDADARIRALDAVGPSTNWPPGPRTTAPTQRLDYLLVRDTTVVLDACVPVDWVRWAVLSDHLPVMTRLRW